MNIIVTTSTGSSTLKVYYSKSEFKSYRLVKGENEIEVDADSIYNVVAINPTGIASIDFNGLNVEYGYALFKNWTKVKTIEGLATEGMTTMKSMFSGCSNLEDIDFTLFDTSKVQSMKYMFYGCSSLKDISLPFDTNNVYDMSYMFYSCRSAENIDLFAFMTHKLCLANAMFGKCPKLETVAISGDFDTYMLNKTDKMFAGDDSLKTIYCNGTESNNYWRFQKVLAADGYGFEYDSDEDALIRV